MYFPSALDISRTLKVDQFVLQLKNGNPIAILLAGISVLLGVYLANNLLSNLFAEEPVANSTIAKKEEPIVLRDYTVEQLRENDGTNGKPIYIALCGEVFDVSSAAEFYGVGSGYHCFAGREASRAMARLSFEEEDLANPSVEDLGPFDRSILDDWIQKFKYYRCYPIVGKVSKPPSGLELSVSQLAAYKGNQEVPANRIHAPIYVGINSKIVDVSYGGVEMYSEGSGYSVFAGADASRALAKMSLAPEDVNNRDLSDLTETQIKTLADWERKFIESKKYPVVGKIIDEPAK
jgi:membrane-associated progesterone receptor component